MDPRIEQLKIVTAQALDAAARDRPELRLRDHGFTLFLGRHYAEIAGRRILMLGLNPGLLRSETGGAFLDRYTHSYDLARSNILLGDPLDSDAKRVRYWRNARRCFGATSGLSTAMERATFSFCCPFRTPKWSELSAGQRRSLEAHSRPILGRILNDCQPMVIIVAGAEARMILLRSGEVSGDKTPRGSGGGKWKLFEARGHWGAVSIVQLPHFSYFNSVRGLQLCGEWLTEVVASDADSLMPTPADGILNRAGAEAAR